MTYKQAATHNRDTKQTIEHKKERPKTQPPRSFPSLQNIPLCFEATGTRGRRLRLAGVSICNRTAAGQPDVESLCPLWAPFRPSDDDESKNPASVGGSMWVSKREIRLGSDIHSGGDGDETRKNGRENDQANIGVIWCDFGKTDLHPQVAEGDGRTLISIGG
jgi:hypothetical protein